jgi:hypothetical protein
MSGISWTQTELIYAYYGASTNLATFTTEDNLLKTYPLVALPLGSLFDDAGSIHSGSLKVIAKGQLGYTTGSPTFNWQLRIFTSPTWSAGGGVLLGQTGALAATASAVTLAQWTLHVDIGAVSAPVAGSVNMTIKSMGWLESMGGLLAPSGGSLPPTNTALTQTIDSTVPYYMFLSCTCGTSNALNLVNTQMFKVYGEN